MPLTLAAINTLLADNTAGDISAQDMRDVVATLYGGGPIWMPATVGSYDDYFDEDNESDWTAVAVTGSVTWGYRFATRLGESRGVHAVFEDQTAEDFPAYVKSLSGIATGDYVQGIVRIAKQDDAAYNFGLLCLTDGTTTASNCVMVGWEVQPTEIPKLIGFHGVLTGPQTYPLDVVTTPPFAGDIHLRLTYSAANTFQLAWSFSGETADFVQIGANISKTMTPTHGGFAIGSYGAGSKQLASFPYFHSNVTP